MHFCQKCLQKWIIKQNSCPNCRGKVTLNEKPEKTLIEDLDDVKIKCKYETCKEIVLYSSLEKHEAYCNMSPCLCKYCGFKGIKSEVDKHLVECTERAFKCNSCGLLMLAKDEKSHDMIKCLTSQLDIAKAYIKELEEKLKIEQSIPYYIPPIVELKFTKLRSKSVIISDGKLVATQTRDVVANSGVAILKPKLSKYTHITFTIKIINLTEWIGIGVGNADSMLEWKYALSDKQLEGGTHNCSLVSANGIRWSMVKEQQGKKGMIFGTGDEVNVKIDVSQDTIEFSANNQKVKMTLGGVGMKLNPIVVLGTKGDSVRVVKSSFK
jgi:hypothetical protein